MAEQIWYWLGIGTIVGVVLTTIVTLILQHHRTVGNLREDRSDPDSPYLFLELTPGGYDKLHKLSRVELNVLLKDYLP